MPSTIIHLCIAKKINEKLKLDEQSLFLGSIAPDISKHCNISKMTTHFSKIINLDEPQIKLFYNKYQTKFNNPFIIGYFTHLIADDLWWKNINYHFFNKKTITLKNNSIIENKTETEITKLIYADYYSLNKKLIDNYQIELSQLKNYNPKSINGIDELTFDQLPLLINNTFKIIDDSKEQDPLLIDLADITKFINDCCNIIIDSFNC